MSYYFKNPRLQTAGNRLLQNIKINGDWAYETYKKSKPIIKLGELGMMPQLLELRENNFISTIPTTNFEIFIDLFGSFDTEARQMWRAYYPELFQGKGKQKHHRYGTGADRQTSCYDEFTIITQKEFNVRRRTTPWSEYVRSSSFIDDSWPNRPIYSSQYQELMCDYYSDNKSVSQLKQIKNDLLDLIENRKSLVSGVEIKQLTTFQPKLMPVVIYKRNRLFFKGVYC